LRDLIFCPEDGGTKFFVRINEELLERKVAALV
jgi:hypothetical protein